MARKASSTGAGGAAGKPAAPGSKAGKTAKSPKTGGTRKAPKPATARKKAASAAKKPQAEKSQGQQQTHNRAGDAVVKLLESPLVVDLIAVGATAALAAIAEQRFGRRDATRSTVKAAGSAAAAAMGRRIASEVEEILKSAKKATDDE